MNRTLLVFLVALTACTSTTPPPATQLREIADEVWARELEDNIEARLKRSLPVTRMPDPSYERAQRDAAFARDIVARLSRIDPASLNDQDRLTHGILRWRQQMVIDALPHFWVLSQVTPYASAARTAQRAFTSNPSPALVADYARYIDDLTTLVKEQQRRGVLLPKPELPLVRGVYRNPPAGIDSAVINAALQRFQDAIGADYEKAAPEGVGMSQYPGGSDAYRYLMRLHTSLDLTPEEVHQLGLSEIARIERELEVIRNELAFEGTAAGFHQHLKTNPRLFESSAEGIQSRLARYVTMIEPHIDRFFARKPRAPYGVARLDPALEGAMTFGYYQRPTPADPTGHYYFNGSKTTERNLLFGLALMAHELVPGHHFQISRQEENEDLHPLRRESYDTAFVEGWGEYAAALGSEMGIYTDPYDRAGRLMMDSMLSARLVVDTGMNALGWSRERAMQYLKEHSMLTDTEIATETLRYSTDIPGQALAYKIGSLRMLAMRARAKAALGPRFDEGEFHEWILDSGSMPLALLEERVQRFLPAVPHVRTYAQSAELAVALLRDVAAVASIHRTNDPDAATRAKIREILSPLQNVEELTRFAQLSNALLSGAAEDQYYDAVIELAQWECVEKLATIPGDWAADALHRLHPILGPDGHPSEMFAELIAKQKSVR